MSERITGSVTNLSQYFSFYADVSWTQSIPENCSYVTVSTYWATTNTLRTFDTTSARPASITINGGEPTSISRRFDCNPWDSSGIYLIQTVESYRVDHNVDGTKTITISARANGTASSYGPSNSTSSSGDCTLSGQIVLPQIPRYATVSQTLTAKTETTASIRWTSDSTVDYIWYSSNNGSSWTGIDVSDGTSGEYTISGLSANTTYQIKTRVRRKDSQLTTDSSALSVKTYSYPYANSMPDFTIGDRLTIGFYNPLGRSFTIYIVANGTQITNHWTISGTSYSGLNDSTTKSQLYATIPNATSATYSVKCVYGGSMITKTGGTFSVNQSECLPTISTVTYQDTNSTVVAITGNNQKIVRNQSTVRFTASGLGALNSASISSVSLLVNGQTYSMSRSGTSATGGNASIDSASNVTATVTITDSRGLQTSKSVTVTMLDWILPSAIITLRRESNFYSETNITVDADFSYVDGNNTIQITYKARKQGTSSWTVTGTLSDNVTSQFTADNQFKWDVQVILVDRFGGTTTYNLTLNKGMPLMFYDTLHNSVGVNGFPVNDDSFEVFEAGIFTEGLLRGVSNNSGATYTLPRESGRTLRLTRNGAVTVTVPEGLPIGYEAILCTTYQSARLTIVASGSDGFYVGGMSSVLTSVTLPNIFQVVHLIKVNTTRWILLDNSPDCYTAGDTITQADVRFGMGYVTSSSTNLSFELSVPKPIIGVSSVTVNSMIGNCRCGQGGYLQYYDGTTYTNINTTNSPQWSSLCDSMDVSVGTGYIHVSMNCTAKFGRSSANVTNNSLVLVQFSTLSLTFS